jgi:EpsI family protein
VVIEKAGQRQLVYYWFQGRGRAETSESHVKLHILEDGIIRNRTDGALIRLVAPVDPRKGGEAHADQVLSGFVRSIAPLMSAYVPD